MDTQDDTSNTTGKSGFHHGNLHEAAGAVAYDLVREGGVQALSVRGVAAACGVDHRALYRHYSGKPALIAAVILRGFRELNSYITADSVNSSFDLLKRYTEFSFHHPHIYDLMFSDDGRRLFDDPDMAVEIKLLTTHSARLAIQRENESDEALRDRVIRGWALAHGLIDLYRRGALKAASEEQAFDYIVAQLRASPDFSHTHDL